MLIVCAVVLCSCDQNDEAGVRNEGKFEYRLSVDETYYILTANKNKDATSVVIESSHKGLPVKTIASKAFVGCMSLKSIIIPDNITTIEKGAFIGCPVLEEITLPYVIGQKEGQSYFGYLFSLEQYPGNSYVPSTLTKVTITSGEKITNGVFSNCESITEIVLPNTITRIDSGAFHHSDKLTTINIPGSVTYIDRYAFEGCEALEKVVIEDLAKWCHIGFNESTSNPLKYGKLYLDYDGEYQKNVIIPSGATKINSYAFYGCDTIETVVIPNTVEQIGAYIFSECTSLSKVTIPASANYIAKRAFYNCENLTDVVFENVNGWTRTYLGSYKKDFSAEELSVSMIAAKYLKKTYVDIAWNRGE